MTDLASATAAIDAIAPLGRMLGTMPVGPEHPGATAGGPFELFY